MPESAKVHRYIEFEVASPREAGELAQSLALYFSSQNDVEGRVVKEDKGTLDLGTTVEVVLNAAAVVAIAKGARAGIPILAQGFADWLSKKHVKVTIKRPEEQVVAQGVSGKDVENIARALRDEHGDGSDDDE